MQVSKLKNSIEQSKSGAGELVVVEGLHAIKHALRFKAIPETIVARDKSKLLGLSQKLCPDITPKLKKLAQEVGEQFDTLTRSQIRTGVLGLFQKPAKHPIPNSNLPTVLLDDPKDLDNIGAVVRVCAAAGVNCLIITGDANPWNSRAIRAGAGLQFAIDIICSTESTVQGSMQNLPIISFDERGEVLDTKLKLRMPQVAIYVFGSERDGISKNLKDKSEKIIRLPMQEGVSSLNLATSVSAALYSLK